MIIGYGFKDAHINKFITDAYELNKFSVHMMHPEGRDYLRKINNLWNTRNHGYLFYETKREMVC